MECIIHYNDVNESDVRNLTDTNFNTLKKCAQQWLSLEGVEKVIALKHKQLWDNSSMTVFSTISHKYGFHRRCYCRFTNKRNIEKRISARTCSKKKVPEDDSDNEKDVVPAKVLRSSSSLKIHEKNRPAHLLPMLCIICGKKESNLSKPLQVRMGRKKDILHLALTKDAG